MTLVSKKALVLGGKTGLLGQALVQTLTSKGWQVYATGRDDIDLFSTNCFEQIANLVEQQEPEYIFNTVAYTNVELAEDEPENALQLNKVLPDILVRVVKGSDTHLVHYSTDFVFDGRKKSPYTIDDVPSPLCVYGNSKYLGEVAVQEAGHSKYSIIRTAWLFGAGKTNFVHKILNICRKNKNAKVVFDQIGSPTYTLDLAQYSLALIEVGGTGLFHIVNSGQASWCELADEAASYAQVECRIAPVQSSEFPQKALRPAYSVLDCSSFTQRTGITPRPWPQALREYLLLEMNSN